MNTYEMFAIFWFTSLGIMFLFPKSLAFWSGGRSKNKKRKEDANYDYRTKVRRSSEITTVAVLALFSLIPVLIIFPVAVFAQLPFISAYYWVIFSAGFTGVLFMVFSEQHDIGGREKLVKFLVFFIALLFVIVAVWGWGGIDTASHYNNEIQSMPGSALFTGNALPYDRIPIVSEPYASYIATSHLSDFGGNAIITDNEMIVYNQTPYWIFSVAPTNVFAVNHLLGFVMVNAVNANYSEIFQKSYVGAGLWFMSNSILRSYVGNTQYMVGNHYPQPAPDGTVDYVVTTDSYTYNGVLSFGGGVVYNPNGSVALTWKGLNAPNWINQPWDKSLLNTLISTWATSRTGNNSFGFFASGFFTIKASPWMMQVDNGSELIPYGNGTAYMQFLSPASNPNGLGGVMLATGNHIYFYNMEGRSMISAGAAKATVQSKLPALSGAIYLTANPILYPIGNYYAWIVPYYSQESSTNIIQLQGVGIVDAENSAHFVDIQSQFATVSSTGVEKLMANAVESFLHSNTVQNTTNATKVEGIITHIEQFDQNGSTVVGIQLNDSSWYFAGASYLNDSEMISVLSLTINETVYFEVSGNRILEVIPVG